MIKTLAFLKRKPGMSRADFIEQYETGHAPFGVTVMPTAKRYLRRYMRPVAENFPEPDFDVITEVWFEDQKAYVEAMAHLSSPDIAKLVAEDEEKLFDRGRSMFANVEEHETRLRRSSAAENGATKFLAFLRRKAGMANDDFIRYYETAHSRFAAQYLDKATRYQRRFLQPIPSPIGGTAPAPNFSVLTEVWFASENDMRETHALTGTPEIAALFAEDEENLFDRSFMKFAVADERETAL